MRKEICRPAEKIRKLVKKCLHSNRFYDIVIKLAVRQRKWSIGQAVKTPPSHGGNRGSIPLQAVNYLRIVQPQKTPESDGSGVFCYIEMTLQIVKKIFNATGIFDGIILK